MVFFMSRPWAGTLRQEYALSIVILISYCYRYILHQFSLIDCCAPCGKQHETLTWVWVTGSRGTKFSEIPSSLNFVSQNPITQTPVRNQFIWYFLIENSFILHFNTVSMLKTMTVYRTSFLPWRRLQKYPELSLYVTGRWLNEIVC